MSDQNRFGRSGRQVFDHQTGMYRMGMDATEALGFMELLNELDSENSALRRELEECRAKTIEELRSIHHRAVKLMLKEKPFIVVANDEPYYIRAYEMIREHEQQIGRWSIEDEEAFRFAKAKKE